MIPTPSSPGHNQGKPSTSTATPIPSSSGSWHPIPAHIPFPAPVSTPGPTLPGQTYGISQQQTAPQPSVTPLPTESDLNPDVESEKIALPDDRRKRLNRVVAVGLLLALLVALFFTWNTATPAASPTTTTNNPIQQNFTGTTNSASDSSTSSSTSIGNTITVYIVGAVNHPGVYSLPSDARVYQLLQAAGGPQPDANLVALNLASKLTDGEEIYVIHIGEVPPAYYGGVPQLGTGNSTGNSTGNGSLININTATSDQMRQALHISSTTAQNIINYRTQNGPFTSVDQLQQVVSQSIYNKIKDEVTV